jgi:hypothetical protein
MPRRIKSVYHAVTIDCWDVREHGVVMCGHDHSTQEEARQCMETLPHPRLIIRMSENGGIMRIGKIDDPQKLLKEE